MLFFCLFQCFAEKEYQTESKRNETFGRVIFGTNATHETWRGRQGSNEDAMRQGGAPRGVGAPPTLVGPSWLPQSTSFAYIYSYTPKTSESTKKLYFHRRNTSVPKRSQLGSFSGAPPEGESITEGFYITTTVSPMMCE